MLLTSLTSQNTTEAFKKLSSRLNLLAQIEAEMKTDLETMMKENQINDSCYEEFKKGILSKHNEYRQLHDVEPLVWDETLESDSKIYTKYIAKLGKIIHSSMSVQDVGESIYFKGSLEKFTIDNDSCKSKKKEKFIYFPIYFSLWSKNS